jgi:hypothetical protein
MTPGVPEKTFSRQSSPGVDLTPQIDVENFYYAQQDEVFEASGFTLCVSVSGSSNHPNIGLDGSNSTDTLEFVFLQNTQQSDLRLGRKLSNFIEKDRASFG